ncbi:MAG: cell division protein CrgA, partial [Actinomycetota bacterium]|nr:cell division protein CrgA [Actinomycetota bacterium]
ARRPPAAILTPMARRTKEVPRKSAPTPKGARAPQKGGRVTPKGGNKPTAKSAAAAPVSTGRYTPPIPKTYKTSPVWVPVLLIGLLVLGMLTILCNYLGLLPGGAKNTYLLVGLFFITCGFITATRYR